ncbi:MAG: [FeFe] hydrogenase H-cluster radical SAM maturase HydE [Lachnospiraceae bacterium]|nr:[FeFe] hydrogenase H-cluster radical SAM maturase HydE [Lachnospiraceae bacterium]
MSENLQELVNQLLTLGTLSAEQFTYLLRFRDADTTEYLFQKATEVKMRQFDRGVYLWGRLPFSNYCKYDCKYCGLQRSNQFVKRYRLELPDILHYCREAYNRGVRNFLLESGVDLFYTEENLAKIISEIHKHFSDCGIILSVGERTKAAYGHWFHAGAGAALMNLGTSNDIHFKRLHPGNMSLLKRKQCMWEMQELGYQTGTGFLVGTPNQTMEQVAEDLLFMKQFSPNIVSVSPYLPANHTSFEKERSGNGEMVLYILAILRLMLPGSFIIADTSLEQTMQEARLKTLGAGANVVIADIVDEVIREKYQVYNRRILRRQTSGDHSLTTAIQNAGYQVERRHI